MFFLHGRKTQRVTRTDNSIGKTKDPVQMCGITSTKPDATMHANNTGEIRCAMTLTKNRALVLISECKEKPDQSMDDEERKSSLMKSLAGQNYWVSKQERFGGNGVAIRPRQGAPRYFPGCQRHERKNLAISTLMKFSWSQTQYSANRVAITKLHDTHSTNVDLYFLQQVTKSRNKTCVFPTSVFWTGKPWVKTCSCSEGSQLHHKARERNKHAVKKQYTRMLERYRKDMWYRQNLQSQNCERKASKSIGPSCRRTKTRTRRYRSRMWSLVKHALPTANVRRWNKHRGHPWCRKQQKGHQQHVRSQRTNTSTQPQSSNWQCQNWRSWQSGKNSISSTFPSPQNGKTRTPTLTYVASGHRKRDVERVLHDLDLPRNTAPHAFFQRCRALRTGTHSCLISTAVFQVQMLVPWFSDRKVIGHSYSTV